jgi:hypothetical protein
MKKWKQLMILFQSAALLTLLSPSVFAEEAATSGTLNDGAQTWEYADGTLTFSGSGDLAIGSPKQGTTTQTQTLPWADYTDDIQTIVFSDGITGAGIFHDYQSDLFPNLTAVSFGESFGTACDCGFCSIEELITFLREKGDVQYFAPQYSLADYWLYNLGYEAQFTPTGVAEDPYVQISGSCDESAAFSYTDTDRTLHITGSGEKVDTSAAESLLGRYRRITVDRDITSLMAHGYLLFSKTETTTLYYHPELSSSDLSFLKSSLGDKLRTVNLDGGDVDRNDTVDLTDATLIVQYYAATAAGMSSELDEIQLKNADIDQDDTVTLTDASLALSYYAQTAAGLSPDWETILYS